MKILTIILFITLGCHFAFAGSAENSSDEKKFRWNKVQCSYPVAVSIADKAALEKFPEHKDVILSDQQPGFSERHGGGEQETIIREYVLFHKYIEPYISRGKQYFRYTEKGKMYYHESYYQKSIKVILDNSCKVIDVRYEDGVSYIVI